MRVHLVVFVYLMAGVAVAQSPAGQIVPTVTTARVEDGSVMVLHLAPGYATSVRLPEEISSVVIGNPASFKAEHSEAEARLVFFKPTTNQPSESNALITTKSGQEISLHLVSAGKGAADARVDFLVEYRAPQSVVISPDKQTFSLQIPARFPQKLQRIPQMLPFIQANQIQSRTSLKDRKASLHPHGKAKSCL